MSCCQALHIFDDVNFCMCGLIWLISHSLAVLFDSCVFVQPALITEKAQTIAGFPAVNRRSSSTMLFSGVNASLLGQEKLCKACSAT